MCNGTKTVAEISQNLSRKLKQPITEDVIWLALDVTTWMFGKSCVTTVTVSFPTAGASGNARAPPVQRRSRERARPGAASGPGSTSPLALLAALPAAGVGAGVRASAAPAAHADGAYFSTFST